MTLTNRGARLASLAMLSLVGACSTVDENPQVGPPPNGVVVRCLNDNLANYWWVLGLCDGAPNCVEPKKVYGPIHVCAAPDTIHPDFDLDEDFDYGGTGGDPYPDWDDELRSLCSATCVEKSDDAAAGTPVCNDASWTGFASSVSGAHDPWVPGNQPNCGPKYAYDSLAVDPHGKDIDWSEGQGPPLSLPLSCSLADDCVHDFDGEIDEWVLGFGAATMLDPIDPDARQADYSAHSGPAGTSLHLDMSAGEGPGYDDSEALVGHAEYSAAACGASTCPFYLAAFEASNMDDSWKLWVDVAPILNEPKIVEGVVIEALRSTLAAWRPSTGQVAFLPGSLVFQVTFTVGSECPTCTGVADGQWSVQLANDEVVYGVFDPADGSLALAYSFEIPGGEGILDLVMEAEGHPPHAALGLPEYVECNTAGGYKLSPGDSASFDADADIDGLVWYVDGIAQTSGFILPVGPHTIDLLAVDSRGARSRAGLDSVEVVLGESCL